MICVNTDHGCGIIRRGNQDIFVNEVGDLTYDFLDRNRNELLNLISVEEFRKRLK